jgi:RNA polymerase sigma-70 factor
MTPNFDELYITWYARAKRFAATYVKSEDDAEDIVQDVFIKLYEHPTSVENHFHAIGYLFTSIRNACLNYLRDKLRQTTATTSFQKLHLQEIQLGLDALLQTETDFHSEEDLEHAIENAIARLPERCKQIFIMSKLQGIRHADIAQQLGISVNTIETQMGIAYQKLRQELRNYLPLLLFILSFSWTETQ